MGMKWSISNAGRKLAAVVREFAGCEGPCLCLGRVMLFWTRRLQKPLLKAQPGSLSFRQRVPPSVKSPEQVKALVSRGDVRRCLFMAAGFSGSGSNEKLQPDVFGLGFSLSCRLGLR